MERYHLLCVWAYLQRVQLALCAVRARHSSDNGASNNHASSRDDDHGASNNHASSRDDDHEQHAEPRGVQALLRTELGQLVVQVHVGLLWRLPAMCNNDRRQHCHNNGSGNLRDNNPVLVNSEHDRNKPTSFHDAIAAYLQVLVR